MKTVEHILNFFTDRLAVESVTCNDVIDLRLFCESITKVEIETYVNSLSIEGISELETLKRLIWDCNKQLLHDWHEYQQMLECHIGDFDEGSVDELRDEYLFWSIQLSELRKIKRTVGYLDSPYRYVDSDGIVKDTTDIDVAIREVARAKDESDMDKCDDTFLQPGMVSETVDQFILKRDIALDVIDRYIKMESTVFRTTRIPFERIVGPLADYVGSYNLFDKPIEKNTLLAMLNLSEKSKTYKVNRNRKAYLYAMIRKLVEKMSGSLASSHDLIIWESKVYAYFGMEEYHKKHHNDYLSRNEYGGGVVKFNDELDSVFEEIENTLKR